jgi:hypothetical protein
VKSVGIPFRLSVLAMTMAFSTFVLAPRAANAAPTPAQTITSALITGTTATGGVVSGVLKVTGTYVSKNQLFAQGVLNGTITSATGDVTPIVNQAITGLPVTALTASCPILHLVLGPLSLTLLGLQVNLNQVVLDITAVPGPGNLLGNLLCDVANLLNGGNLTGLLTNISGLLNQILGILNGL